MSLGITTWLILKETLPPNTVLAPWFALFPHKRFLICPPFLLSMSLIPSYAWSEAEYLLFFFCCPNKCWYIKKGVEGPLHWASYPKRWIFPPNCGPLLSQKVDMSNHRQKTHLCWLETAFGKLGLWESSALCNSLNDTPEWSRRQCLLGTCLWVFLKPVLSRCLLYCQHQTCYWMFMRPNNENMMQPCRWLLFLIFDQVKIEVLPCYHYPLAFFTDMLHYTFELFSANGIDNRHGQRNVTKVALAFGIIHKTSFTFHTFFYCSHGQII